MARPGQPDLEKMAPRFCPVTTSLTTDGKSGSLRCSALARRTLRTVAVACRALRTVAVACRALRSVAVAASALSLLLAPTVVRADQPVAAVHVVQPGETLSQIADAAGADSDAIARLNNLDNLDFLVAGQSLTLPSKGVAAPPSAPAASARTITIADGDTLWSIALQYSTTTAALVEANHLDDPDHLTLGAQLVLPASASPSPAASAPVAPSGGPKPAPAPPTAAKRSLLVPYTVQAGETLNQIARQFEVQPDAIAQASSLEDPNRLSIGTVLKVPLPGHEHEVKAGETLRDIALQEKVDLGSLIDFNALDDPELIRVGQVLMVPTPPNLAAVAKPAPSGAGSATAKPSPAAAAPQSVASSSPPPLAPAVAAAPQSAASTSPPPVSAATAAPTSNARPATKAAAPIAVVAPPKGSPTDGLAGAGLKLLGSPYVWGGSSPSGFDCSGYVWYVARQVGKSISRGMLGEYNSGAHPARDELKPGDLVFFQNTYSAGLSHNGIYIGNNQFVHAADEAAGVTISSLGAAYWSAHWFGATRLP